MPRSASLEYQAARQGMRWDARAGAYVRIEAGTRGKGTPPNVTEGTDDEQR